MIFTETKLKGAYLIEVQKLNDNRGFFGRTWCKQEFDEQHLNSNFAQANVSYNRKQGTLRGMHYQIAPFQETKLIRCTRGALFDVIIDLRSESPSYGQWFGVTLDADSYTMLYVPEDFAHGFITLEDDTEAVYQVSQFYTPGAEQGIRWDDPNFGIKWPVDIQVISEKDRGWPSFRKIIINKNWQNISGQEAVL